MRLSIIRMDGNETIFYNLGIFSEEEDLIVFPYDEFIKFYDEIMHHLKLMNIVMEHGTAGTAGYNSKKGLKFAKHYHGLIKKNVKTLLKFEVQTTLNAFKKIQEKEAHPQETIFPHDKNELQCLMGL